jgi:hypothetical protein
MFKTSIIAAFAAIAFAGAAHAGDIGGGIALGNMSSFAAGGNVAGQVGVAGVIGNGAVVGHVTQSAHSDQIAGTTATLKKLPDGMQAQIVSEYAGNSWTQLNTNLSANGNAAAGALSAGLAGGLAFSNGQQVYAISYLNW